MDKTKIKQIIVQSTIILLGVLLLISLAFPLIKATYERNGTLLGYSYTYDDTYTDTGFKMFDFKSSLPYVEEDAHILSIILGLFAYLQLFLSLAIIAIGITGFFIKNEKIGKAAFVVMIVGVSFSAWYMLEGILYSAIYPTMNSSTASTVAWLSFLLCALPFTAYILCKYLIKNDIELPTDHPNSNLNKTQKPTVKSTMNSIALLKQYKELLDDGVITQEEFDEKKKGLI